ncbi:MAG: hypothetical protein ACFFFC_00535 [Candidatus Thorarchaeota archaeon]
MKKDKLEILSPTKCGYKVAISGDGGIKIGELRELKEGMPMGKDAEIVKLSKCKEYPIIWDIVERISLNKGPIKVTSKSYRDNYDGIFGKSDKTKFVN